MRRCVLVLLVFFGFVLLLGLAGASDRESQVEANYRAARVHVARALESGQ